MSQKCLVYNAVTFKYEQLSCAAWANLKAPMAIFCESFNL